MAATFEGYPYQMPPGPNSFDCSSYVLEVYFDAGLPFPTGVRTAEQIRQACTPVDGVQPGDLVFFEHTYASGEAPGPDGHVATHVSIVEDPAAYTVWHAVDPAVKRSAINTSYWEPKLLSIGRYR